CLDRAAMHGPGQPSVPGPGCVTDELEVRRGGGRVPTPAGAREGPLAHTLADERSPAPAAPRAGSRRGFCTTWGMALLGAAAVQGGTGRPAGAMERTPPMGAPAHIAQRAASSGRPCWADGRSRPGRACYSRLATLL